MAFLPIIAAVAGIGSSLIGAVGAIKSGEAQAQSNEYNARVKEIQANQTVDQAGVKASNEAVKTRQRVAAARAGSIQNGFENEGSVTDILRTVETQGALEGITALYDGTVRAQGLRQGAAVDKMAADNARTAGYIGAGTSILSGASKFYTSGGTNALGLG